MCLTQCLLGSHSHRSIVGEVSSRPRWGQTLCGSQSLMGEQRCFPLTLETIVGLTKRFKMDLDVLDLLISPKCFEKQQFPRLLSQHILQEVRRVPYGFDLFAVNSFCGTGPPGSSFRMNHLLCFKGVTLVAELRMSRAIAGRTEFELLS